MKTNLQVSNIHKAYGDDSVYQVLVGCDKHVEDGVFTSDWGNIGYDKIRAVKDSGGLYLTVIRASGGKLMYESHSVFDNPPEAIEFGKTIYKDKFVL